MTVSYENLMRRLDDGDRILIDGGMGTEIERQGVVTIENAWSSTGALNGPDIVREVHEQFLRAGAELIISNTFSTSRHALTNAGLGERFEELNRRGIELAREAIENAELPAVVAGGISHWFWAAAPPSNEELRRNVIDQAAIMADAGADLLMLEMMADLERTKIVLESAQASGLPVWVGYSCEIDEHGTARLLDGPTLDEGIDLIRQHDVPVVSIMHTEVADIDACLDVLDETWDRPVGVYAHSGAWIEPNWFFNDVISPADHSSAASRWLGRGVQVIGGCCGIGPAHIEDLARLPVLDER